MANIKELSDEDLKKKINSAKIAIERNTGMIKDAAEKKLVKLEEELSERAGEVKKAVKEDVKAVEKEVKKVEKKVEKAVEKVIEKPVAKKATPKKKPRVYASPTEKFELTIDGQVFKFSDLASKNECEKATKAVQARYKEVKEHNAARKEGIERAATIPVTKRISDGFASIAKKAVSEIPATKITKNPEGLKRELEAVEEAFKNLFDKLATIMGKEIPKAQRKQIMDILKKFEDKVDKGTDKKEVATTKVRKEQGGMAGESKDYFGAGNPYSYASLM